MKWMLMAMGVAAIALAAGSILAADSATTPAPAPAPEKGQATKGHVGQVAEKLGLTDDQKVQVKAILKAAHEQAKAATDPEAKKKIMHEAFAKIKTTVLTDAQRTELAKMKEQWKANHPKKAPEATPDTAK